ncbi:MAG: chromate efflux transporter [Chloroflexia bacterium]
MTSGPLPAQPHPLREVAGLFLRLGIIGFGGPSAHVAMMEQEVVHKRGWLERQAFLDALAATNLVPGPNSTEMAIHIGYLRAGRVGGLVAGLLFILPAFGLMLGLSWAYVAYGAVPQVDAVFYGLKPAVLAVILVTTYRLGRAAVTDRNLVLLGLFSLAVGLLVPGAEIAALLVAGVAGLLLYAPRPASTSLKSLLITPTLTGLWYSVVSTQASVLALAWVFLKAGALLFGGGYVMIPLVEPEVVGQYGWLTHQQFLDGIALGQSTPGPIVITATFIGYVAGGLPGALVATAAIFLPAFVLVLFLTGPFTNRLRNAPRPRAFLKGVNAAVVGAILAAALTLSTSAIIDLPTLAILAASLLALLRLRWDTLWVLLGGGLVGLVLRAMM